MSWSLRTKNTLLNITLFVLGLLVFFYLYNAYLNLQESPEKDENGYPTTGSIIQVEVLNGTSNPGLAKKLSDYLKEKNFDVVIQGNYESQDVRRTFLIDHLGDELALKRTLRVLGLKPDRVRKENRGYQLTDITIVIGEDYQQLNSDIKW